MKTKLEKLPSTTRELLKLLEEVAAEVSDCTGELQEIKLRLYEATTKHGRILYRLQMIELGADPDAP